MNKVDDGLILDITKTEKKSALGEKAEAIEVGKLGRNSAAAIVEESPSRSPPMTGTAVRDSSMGEFRFLALLSACPMDGYTLTDIGGRYEKRTSGFHY